MNLASVNYWAAIAGAAGIAFAVVAVVVEDNVKYHLVRLLRRDDLMQETPAAKPRLLWALFAMLAILTVTSGALAASGAGNGGGAVPADSVAAIRVIRQTHNELVLEVKYSLDPIHAEPVWIGACLYGHGSLVGDIPAQYGGFCGYVPHRVSAGLSRTTRVTIRPYLSRPSESDEVEVFLNREGPGDTFIASRRFPFVAAWNP